MSPTPRLGWTFLHLLTGIRLSQTWSYQQRHHFMKFCSTMFILAMRDMSWQRSTLCSGPSQIRPPWMSKAGVMTQTSLVPPP